MSRPAKRIVLVGFGAVGRAFARLVDERAGAPATTAGRPALSIAAIATTHGTWIRGKDGSELDPAQVADELELGRPFEDVPGVDPRLDGLRAIGEIPADLLVEAGPTDLTDGEPGTSYIRAAFERDWDVVVASKGAMVVHGPELIETASRRGRQLRYGAAAAAALPTLDVARWGLTGARVERIEGILNGTSNAILTDMRRKGSTFAEALARAQAAGTAERDPRLDVGGWDTAAKLVLIAGAVWEAPLEFKDAEVSGVEAVSPPDIAAASSRDGTIRLLGTAWLEGRQPRVRVGVVELPGDHPLAHVDGAEKAITFVTDTLGRITVAGGESSPRAAAAALLRDVLNLAGCHGPMSVG